ncbi:class I SAM-dependent RNA methyltransferase [Altererythrobacter sp. CAU 1778]
MSEYETIERIAAKGDGVTASGRHVPNTAPLDRVLADGKQIERGPHYVTPPCRHFGECGGCQLQHCDFVSLAQFVSQRVEYAASGQELEIGELLSPHLSTLRTRRRCTLHVQRKGKNLSVGFRQAGGHAVVDMRQCEVLAPELFALVAPLRKLLDLADGKTGDIDLAVTDQGIDCAIRGFAFEGLAASEALTQFAKAQSLARLAIDYGYGPEPVWEPEPVSITLSGVAVSYPMGSFLQATEDAEAVMVAQAREWLSRCARIADLFAGLGTFAFALADQSSVVAVEAARDAHLACTTAARRSGRNVETSHRDLFRNPLQSEELAAFDAVLLDPPRAGAREQVASLAQSSVQTVVYVSCNPSSWARDVRTLVEGGFTLEQVRPVGQFTWSTHVELVSLLTRKS